MLSTRTHSDTRSMRAASNASELRASRLSLNRNYSVHSSAKPKRSSRNLARWVTECPPLSMEGEAAAPHWLSI